MKKLAIGLLVVLVLVVGGIFAVPLFIDKNDLLARAETEASEQLGRSVTIADVTGVSIFPPRLTIEGLEIANADGFEEAFLARVGEAQLGVKFMPLLSSRVEIERFVLVEPDIRLESRADGRVNYNLGTQTAAAAEQTPSQSFEEAPIVGVIEAQQGRVSYASPDASYAASDVDAVLTLPEIGDPLTLKGDAELEGVPLTLDLSLASPWALSEGKSSEAALAMQLGSNTFEGDVMIDAEASRLSGPMTIALPAPGELAAFVGDELPQTLQPFGAISIGANAAFSPEAMVFEDTKLETGLGDATGRLAIDLSAERPKIEGALSAGRADLRPFFPEDLQNDAAEAEESFPEWSTEPIDLSGLQAADASISFQAEEVLLPTYTLAGIDAALALENGRAVMTLRNAQTLGGRASGTLTVNGRSARPAIDADLTFADVAFAEAGPALFGTARLIGRGTIAMDVATGGPHQKAWVENLGGTAKANIAEGRVLGIDLSALANAAIQTVDNIQKRQDVVQALTGAFGPTLTTALQPGAETAFDLANFDLAINDGVTRFGEARLVSETFRATLNGGVDLGAQEIALDILLAAKAPEASSFREFKAPLDVSGTFNDPKISIDTRPIVRELTRDAASDLLGDAGIELRDDQSVGDALKERARSELFGILGGRKKADDGKAAEPADTDDAGSGGGTSEDPPQE
jgi:AsmA protein